jgi:hypothetical protein
VIDGRREIEIPGIQIKQVAYDIERALLEGKLPEVKINFSSGGSRFSAL